MPTKKALYLTMVIEPNDDGYLARCPGIQGAFAKGDTGDSTNYRCAMLQDLFLYQVDLPTAAPDPKLAA